MEKIGLLLVDDDTSVRHGLRAILTSDPDIEVVGEAADGESAVESAKRLRPAVVLMDIRLPGLNGIDATREINRTGDGVSVLLLTLHADEAYLREGLRAGARGYVLKDAEELDVIAGVKAVAHGGCYFSPSLSRLSDPTPASQKTTE